MSTARDEAIEAMVVRYQERFPCIDPDDDGETEISAGIVAGLLDAIPPAVKARIAIDEGGFVQADVWDRAPSDPDRVRVYYEDEGHPADAVPLYRLAEGVE